MPEIPEGAKKPQDHKTKSKKPKKPKKGPIELEFRGHTYTLPAEIGDDVEIAEAFQEGRPLSALKIIMGERQYLTMKQNLAGKKGVTKASDVAEFANAVLERYDDLKG